MLTSAASHSHRLRKLGQIGTLCFTFAALLVAPSVAAERVNLKLGLFEQTVNLEDLKQFAETGQLASDLKPYRLLLNAEVQKALQKKLHVDSFLAQQFLEDLFNLPDGEKLLNELHAVLIESPPEQIKKSLILTIHRSERISLLSFLEAYPAETLTIDVSAIAKIALQINLSYLQNQLLSPRLTQDLQMAPSRILSAHFDPAKLGTEDVHQDSRMFFDRARNRTIVADIYYTFKPRGPLVVMSHGFAADRRFLGYLAYHLASHGLTVVSIEHPGSNINALVQITTQGKISQILPASEFIERPKDISFILNELEKINRKTGYLKGKFNTQQVSIIGHSFGGYTALALAGGILNPKELRQFCQNSNPLERSPADWLQCAAAELPYGNIYLKDRRIVQAIALNPIIGHLFAQDLSSVNIPTLILSSTEDGITPIVPHQLQPFQQMKGEKYLIVAAGATHMSVTDISYLNSAMGQSTLVREIMDEKAEPVREMARGLSLAFIQQMTAQADVYQPYLTATYVQSLSNHQINLRLTHQLPNSIVTWLKILQKEPTKATSIAHYSNHSLLNQIRGNWNHFKSLVEPKESYTVQLEPIFTDLLKHYTETIDPLG
jgi:predicted dienelactone hydrolase